MAAHNTNPFLKIGGIVFIGLVCLFLVFKVFSGSKHETRHFVQETSKNNNAASNDSAAESLDTLTAELAQTRAQVNQINKDNALLKDQNAVLLKKAQGSEDEKTATLSQEVEQLKNQVLNKSTNYPVGNANIAQPITTVPDVAEPSASSKLSSMNIFSGSQNNSVISANKDVQKPKPVPYYTIPANATAVRDRLMTALVGRIPVKGVVTDPYPFKIVFSDDTLAANGLRVPHLQQMIVSGYCEGDLNLVSVRGWVTSLTFVFDDGTISTTTSNNNDIGHYTKENALGFLSDKRGNPFINGKLITNAPGYLAGNVALGAAQGAASAYAQAQTTNQTSILGSVSSSVTGSSTKYVLGQAGVNAANQAQQWWHDREENSFDAVYVSTVEDDGTPREIAVNFAKEIQIDYNPEGRKIAYARKAPGNVSHTLD